MKYQLFDSRLKAHFGPVQPMSAEAALVANRDLYLSGKTWLGWKPIELSTPERPKPPIKVKPPEGLVEALVALGHKQREAKRLASTVSGGTVEEGIRQLYAKELAPART